jgi:mevalonate kinase
MTGVLRAQSPAKLILSGEHAVVYGKPALAMAVNRYAQSTITATLTSSILFNLLNLDYARSFSWDKLLSLKKKLQDKYLAFLEGRIGIREVLKKPFELLQYTVSNLIEKWPISLPHGLEISAASDIPIGCGMGSSAALVMSTLYALAHYLKLDIDFNKYLTLGREAENLQHGLSSGLDLQIALQGGCIWFQEGRTENRPMPRLPMSIVQTGVPLASTGECVNAVIPFFKKGSMADDFALLTQGLDLSLRENNLDAVIAHVKENHSLLTKIGVVPLKVQQFIKAIEQQGGAAKICGAGSITGDTAGVVMVVSAEDLSPLVAHYGYKLENLKGDTYGTRII